MKITKLRRYQIKKALNLTWEVFQEYNAREYSQEGIVTFKRFIAYDSVIHKFNRGELVFWGCTIHHKLVGIIAVTRGINHISLFFVKKEYQRQGIAKNLFQAVIDYFEKEGNVKKITVNSSPYALEVYHHLGFQDTDTEQTVEGIRFTPMEYIM